MKMRMTMVAAGAAALLSGVGPGAALAQQVRPFEVLLEAGPVWQSYNDVEIPNDGSATRFSLHDVLGAGPWPSARLYVTWNISERHALRVLAAPLSIRDRGTLSGPVSFAGETYTPGAVEATYTFNSYRLTYRYRLHAGERTTAWVGLTAKLRDAVIRLERNGTASEKTDLGFVPLLHLAGNWRFAPRWRLALDVDALAGGPGRAEDAALKLGYDLSQRLTLEAGYRTVEGGADVDEVYTFAWLHYAVLAARWRP